MEILPQSAHYVGVPPPSKPSLTKTRHYFQALDNFFRVFAIRTGERVMMLTDPLLLRRGPADPARFDDAEDFLLRVRSTLHLEGERNQNVLSHEQQERTADVLEVVAGRDVAHDQ